MIKAENLEKKKKTENYLKEHAVNTQGTREVPSKLSTQAEKQMYVQHNHLMERVTERQNLKKALERVEKNKGAPGIDGMTTQELRGHLSKNWERIKQELLEGTYQPKSVRRIEIPKPDGGVRLLGIPTVTDRFIQQAIQQILTPIFDPQFSPMSYGFRPKRSAHQAVKQAQIYINQGRNYVIDIDLEKFFDKVNHDILMERLSKRISDSQMLRIIRKYLKAGVMHNGCCVTADEGTPQGGPMSPLLANIILDELDKELENRGHKHVRYADDCNIYVASERAGKRVFESIRKFLENKLKLTVNLAKSQVDRPWKRKFLGFTFSWHDVTQLWVAPRSIERLKERIRQLTQRNAGISMTERITKLNEYIIGWSGYFSIAMVKGKLRKLDEWTRRRLRMCVLKQWKQCKTKLRNLMKLGIRKDWAGRIANSRKKHWRLSNTPQVNLAMNLAYWQEQGLVSLAGRYEELRKTV